MTMMAQVGNELGQSTQKIGVKNPYHGREIQSKTKKKANLFLFDI